MNINNHEIVIPICTQEIEYPSSSEECTKDRNLEDVGDSIPIPTTATHEADPSLDPSARPIIPHLENANEPFPQSVGEVTDERHTILVNEGNDSSTKSPKVFRDEDNDDESLLNEFEARAESLDDLLVFLKSSKKENRNMSYRRELIMNFQTSKIKIDPAQHFISHLKNHPTVRELVLFYRKSLTYRDCDWRAIESAKVLRNLWKLVLLQDDWNQSQDETEPDSKPVKYLREHILPCIARMNSEKENVTRSKRKRNLFKDSGTSVQDNIVLKEHSKWFSRIEPHPCPKCSHNNVVPIVPTEEFIIEFSQKEYEHDQAMKKYEIDLQQATFTKDGKRKKNKAKIEEPRKPIFPKLMVACMCCVTKCRNIVDGRGCHHCHAVAKSKLQIPYNIKTAQCECELCLCNCNIVFPKSSWQNIAADVAQAAIADEKESKMTISTTKSKYPFMHLLLHIKFISNTLISK